MAIALRNSAHNSGTATPATINAPSGTAAGDIIIAAVGAATNNSSVTFSFPAGWTVMDEDGGADVASLGGRLAFAWHAWAPGESTYSVTVTGLSVGSWVTASASYSGVNLSAPIDQHGIGTRATNSATTAATTATVTSATGGLWRVEAFFAQTTSANITWSGYSPADTERQDVGQLTATRRANVAFADSNGTIDASSGTSVSATPFATCSNRVGAIALLAPAVSLSRGFVMGQAVNRAASF